MSGKVLLKGIDVLKLCCAFLIVFLHTYNRDWGLLGGWFYNVFTPVGVPFFFIVSGFFFAKGLIRTEWAGDYLRRYIGRIVQMYVAWTLITLPVSWLCIVRGHGDYFFSLKVVYLFRMIFFSGSCGIYWYILAMICSCPIIYYFTKRHWEKSLMFLAILLFGIGVWYDSPFNNGNLLSQFIHAVFGSERNFLNVGLFYMSVGYLFARYEPELKRDNIYIYAFLVSGIVLRVMEIYWLHTNILQALLAVSLFVLALNIKPTLSNERSLKLRKLSTGIYLLHFPFVLLFDFYLSRGTIVDYSAALCFSILVFIVLNRLLPDKVSAVLFG